MKDRGYEWKETVQEKTKEKSFLFDEPVSTLVKPGKKNRITASIPELIKTAGILVGASLIGLLFHSLGFTEANIITVYIFGVLLTAVTTNHQIYSLISALISVIIFNYLFTTPRFSFYAYGTGYPVTFVIMFMAAFLTGSLAMRMKNNATQSALAALRTRVLLDANIALQQATDRESIAVITAEHLEKLLNMDVILLLSEDLDEEQPLAYTSSQRKVTITGTEREAALWVLKNRKEAGALTERFPGISYHFMPILINEQIYGAVGIVQKEYLSSFEDNIVQSILGECALSLNNEKNARDKEQAAILARNEQLRANLLRSISHDLRTPLTAISGNASNLMENDGAFTEETKKQLYSDIYTDAMWLIDLVENILSVSRLKEDQIQLNLYTEILDDIIDEALLHIGKKAEGYRISFESGGFFLVKVEGMLIVQVLINLINNALKYTPPGSEITIRTFLSDQDKDQVFVQVADNGPGIPDEKKPYVFDMFYSGSSQIADSRRSMGLGLSLCKSIIHAHEGSIQVSDNTPTGTIFTFSLPIQEVSLNE